MRRSIERCRDHQVVMQKCNGARQIGQFLVFQRVATFTIFQPVLDIWFFR